MFAGEAADEAQPPARRSTRARPGRPPRPAPPSLPTVTEDTEEQDEDNVGAAESGQELGHRILCVKTFCQSM